MANFKKSYIFAWFSIWTILAQTSFYEGIQAKAIQKSETKDDVKSANNNDSSEYPSLSCILFHVKGCLLECTMKGASFSQEVKSECSENNFCQCTITDDTSYETLWGKKFGHDSEDLRDEIRKNNELYEKVLAILQTPFRTGQQIKTELQPLLTESQYERLKVEDRSAASLLMTNKDNTLNLQFIRQFFEHFIRRMLESYYKVIFPDVQYDAQLLEALDHYHGEHFTHLSRDIRRTENKALIYILDQYLNENSRKQEAKQEDTDISLPERIEYRVIDEFVRNINRARNELNTDELRIKDRLL